VYTAITDFSAYFGRAAFVSVFNSGSMSMDSFPLHILRTLGMFLFTGDPNPRHDVSALPLLGLVLVVPFLLGIWHCWRRRDDHGYALVLLGLPVFLRDERLTSHVAESRLGPMPRGRSGGPPSRTQRDRYRERVDREAAAIILQDELDARRSGDQRAGSEPSTR